MLTSNLDLNISIFLYPLLKRWAWKWYVWYWAWSPENTQEGPNKIADQTPITQSGPLKDNRTAAHRHRGRSPCLAPSTGRRRAAEHQPARSRTPAGGGDDSHGGGAWLDEASVPAPPAGGEPGKSNVSCHASVTDSFCSCNWWNSEERRDSVFFILMTFKFYEDSTRTKWNENKFSKYWWFVRLVIVYAEFQHKTRINWTGTL